MFAPSYIVIASDIVSRLGDGDRILVGDTWSVEYYRDKQVTLVMSGLGIYIFTRCYGSISCMNLDSSYLISSLVITSTVLTTLSLVI